MSHFASLVRIIAPLSLLAVAGCATPFNAQVSRFQALPVPQGQSFYVSPANARDVGSLEFKTYANLVGSKLAAVGYAPAADAASANLVVMLDYDVDAGKEKTRSVPLSGFGYGAGFGYPSYNFGRRHGGYSPYFGGYGRRGFIYGFYDPFLFGSGYGDETESYTVYTSDLSLTIARKDGERVFEGKAQAMSTDNVLPRLVPNLIEAMFTGFPGNSGETVKITVAPSAKR